MMFLDEVPFVTTALISEVLFCLDLEEDFIDLVVAMGYRLLGLTRCPLSLTVKVGTGFI